MRAPPTDRLISVVFTLDHQVRLGYPAAVIAGARATADWLLEAVAARREPFDAVGAAWLAAQRWSAGTA